jgi:pimeloyl-ACP methyl ester carboxylesterase
VPVLIFHGDADEVIPPEHSAALLAEADARSRRVVISRATHYDWTAAGHAALWSETTAWLDRWLRGPSPP